MTADEGMAKWLRGIRGALVIVLMWVIGWGLGFGGLVEMFVDPSGEILEMWPMELAIPGFLGGAMFAAMLATAARGRSFDQVSFASVVTWGVATGLVLGVLAITTGIGSAVFEGLRPSGDGRSSFETSNDPLTLAAAEAIGVATALGAVAAFGSAVFFRLVAGGSRSRGGRRPDSRRRTHTSQGDV